MRLYATMLTILLLAVRGAAGEEALVVAGTGGQAPLAELQSDGTIGGLEAELVGALCDRLARPCTMTVAPSWGDLLAGLREGRYAIGYGGLSQGTLAGLGIAASTPYLPLRAQWAVVARLDGAADPLVTDAMRIGVIRGTPHAHWLEARLPQERLLRFADEEEMFLSLHTGTVDAVFGDGLLLWRDLLQGPLGKGVVLRGPGQAVEQDGLVLALRDDAAFGEAVDTALAAMARDGTLAALVARHLPGLPLP